MSRSLGRLGAGLFTVALVAAGTFAFAGSASADTDPNETDATLSSDTTSFSFDSWGDGITAHGEGFPASLQIDLNVYVLNETNGLVDYLDVTPLVSSETGEISVENWIPDTLPSSDLTEDQHVFLVATYHKDSPIFYIFGPELTFDGAPAADDSAADDSAVDDAATDDSAVDDSADSTDGQLANTGSGDAGILIGGSAALLLAGAALVAVRRRAAAAK
jgi:LPXTG-motif cell wall-anchored protein